MGHQPARDLQGRLALSGAIGARLGQDLLPEDPGPQPEGVEERIERDALVHAPRGRRRRGLELLRVRGGAAAQVDQQRPGVVHRYGPYVGQQCVVGRRVVDDLGAVALHHRVAYGFDALKEPLEDGREVRVRHMLSLAQRATGGDAQQTSSCADCLAAGPAPSSAAGPSEPEPRTVVDRPLSRKDSLPMQTRTLGQNVHVSALGLGCMA
jgi:hypothetical protein